MRLRRAPANPGAEMSLLEHIAELRNRIVKSCLAVAVTTTVAFFVLYSPVLRFVTKAYCQVPVQYRVTPVTGKCALVNYGVLEPISVRIRLSATIGLVLAFGLTFEFPLVLVSLSLVGILSSQAMLKAWRAAVIVIIVVAAVVTPSQDPFSLFAMAIPMW